MHRRSRIGNLPVGRLYFRPPIDDQQSVNVPSLIRALSILLTAIVVVSFVSFVWDEAGTASDNQLTISRPGAVAPTIVRDPHGRMEGLKHSKTRLKIDEANDAITSPGEALGDSLGGNPWALRGLAFVFGILIFFIGLRLLASWLEMSNVSNANRQYSTRDVSDDDFTPAGR